MKLYLGERGSDLVDAIHLASAVFLTERLGEPLAFSSWDANLAAVAKREGLESLRKR